MLCQKQQLVHSNYQLPSHLPSVAFTCQQATPCCYMLHASCCCMEEKQLCGNERMEAMLLCYQPGSPPSVSPAVLQQTGLVHPPMCLLVHLAACSSSPQPAALQYSSPAHLRQAAVKSLMLCREALARRSCFRAIQQALQLICCSDCALVTQRLNNFGIKRLDLQWQVQGQCQV